MRAPGSGDQVVNDGDDHFADDVEIAFDQQVEGSMDRAREAVLNGRENVVGKFVVDGAERRFKCRTRDERGMRSREFQRRFFAEGATLSLKGDTRVRGELHARAALRARVPPPR